MGYENTNESNAAFIERTNKYIQGSVWHWRNDAEARNGVQAGDRPVMIISNNSYNYYG